MFGGVCSRRHARVTYEQRQQHMAGVRHDPEALQRRGRGRAGDRPSPRRLRGTRAEEPESQGTPASLSVRAVDGVRHLASRQRLARRS